MSSPHLTDNTCTLTESHRLAYLSAMQITSWLPLAEKVNALGPVWQQDINPLHINKHDEWVDHPTAKAISPSVDEPATAPVALNVNTVQANIATLKTVVLESQTPSTPLSIDTNTGAHTIAKPSSYQTPVTALLKTEPPQAKQSALLDSPIIMPISLNISAYMYAHKAGILVINEAPAAGEAQISESIAQLQKAIVEAISGYDNQWKVEYTDFQWPLVPGPYGDKSLAGAQQAFAYTLDKFMQPIPLPTSSATTQGTPTHNTPLFGKLLLLGDRAGELIPAFSQLTHGQVASSKSLIDTQWVGMHIVTSHSLHQLMRVPIKKAEAWQHFQPLVEPVTCG